MICGISKYMRLDIFFILFFLLKNNLKKIGCYLFFYVKVPFEICEVSCCSKCGCAFDICSSNFSWNTVNFEPLESLVSQRLQCVGTAETWRPEKSWRYWCLPPVCRLDRIAWHNFGVSLEEDLSLCLLYIFCIYYPRFPFCSCSLKKYNERKRKKLAKGDDAFVGC